MMNKPILCLDFDGVLHSYTTKWTNARTIPDAPVPGAIDFLMEARETFTLAILSSRSHQFLGRRAMKNWLRRHLVDWLWNRYHSTGEGHGFSSAYASMDIEEDFQQAANRILGEIQFPRRKPPAFLTLDDRALCFCGGWPEVETLLAFKPWNKK